MCVQYTLYIIQCILYTVYYTLYITKAINSGLTVLVLSMILSGFIGIRSIECDCDQRCSTPFFRSGGSVFCIYHCGNAITIHQQENKKRKINALAKKSFESRYLKEDLARKWSFCPLYTFLAATLASGGFISTHIYRNLHVIQNALIPIT